MKRYKRSKPTAKVQIHFRKRVDIMFEKEELKKELESELDWVQYRLKILDIIDRKLLQMKKLANHANESNLNPEELEVLNAKLNNVAAQIKALDEESRKTEYKESEE